MISTHFCFYMMMFIIILCYTALQYHPDLSNQHGSVQADNTTNAILLVSREEAHYVTRKLLQQGSCTEREISISQSKGSYTGIPQFIVQIVNTCVSGCAPSNVHLHCGWFASARLVNPKLFKRLSYDNCLVNGGNPLKSSHVIRFTYSNSFMYPLAFKSANFC